MIRDILRLIRWKHWIKNLFVLAPLFFAARFRDVSSVMTASMAFAAFCLGSSAVYIMNDFIDLQADRHHPVKRNRPLASGRISPALAAATGSVFLTMSLFLAWRTDATVLLVLGVYLLLNVVYSLYAKHTALLDVFVLAGGFLLRLYAGSAAIDAPLSKWILVTTFFLALYLGFGKRHKEQQRSDDGEISGRDTRRYNTELLNYLIAICATLSIMSYSLYVIDPATCDRLGTEFLIVTIPIVAYGIFRYLLLIYKKHEGGDPTENLLHDLPLLLTVALWTTVFLGVLLLAGNG